MNKREHIKFTFKRNQKNFNDEAIFYFKTNKLFQTRKEEEALFDF